MRTGRRELGLKGRWGGWGGRQRRGDVANVVTWVGGEEAMLGTAVCKALLILIERENTILEFWSFGVLEFWSFGVLRI